MTELLIRRPFALVPFTVAPRLQFIVCLSGSACLAHTRSSRCRTITPPEIKRQDSHLKNASKSCGRSMRCGTRFALIPRLTRSQDVLKRSRTRTAALRASLSSGSHRRSSDDVGQPTSSFDSLLRSRRRSGTRRHRRSHAADESTPAFSIIAVVHPSAVSSDSSKCCG